MLTNKYANTENFMNPSLVITSTIKNKATPILPPRYFCTPA